MTIDQRLFMCVCAAHVRRECRKFLLVAFPFCLFMSYDVKHCHFHVEVIPYSRLSALMMYSVM